MFDNLRNSFDFFLRNKIRFSRKNYTEENEDKSSLGFLREECIREKFLVAEYGFDGYKNNSTVVNYCQNLSILDVFDKYLDVETSDKLSVLDIGSKNWFYAPAEYSFFKKYSRLLELDGVELDAYRLYANLYTRYEVAKYYTKDLPETNYITGNVLDITKKYDYIIWILPFMTRYPLRRWGLPDKYFEPERLFEHALSLLNKGGKMVIINQGETEYEIQKQIAGDRIVYSTELQTGFYNYSHKRFLSIIEDKI